MSEAELLLQLSETLRQLVNEHGWTEESCLNQIEAMGLPSIEDEEE